MTRNKKKLDRSKVLKHLANNIRELGILDGDQSLIDLADEILKKEVESNQALRDKLQRK